MPSVFSDAIGTNDLLITTAADWTITAAALPNGDAAASQITALNQNAVLPGAESIYCIPIGSGSEAMTVEAWVNVTAQTVDRYVAQVRTNSTATTAGQRHWEIYVSTSEALINNWFNTGTTFYLGSNVALSLGWNHCVTIFSGGSTRKIEVYINGALGASSTSVSGTPSDSSTAAYELYVGSNRATTTQEQIDKMAKLAIYQRALTSAEITEHYLAMTAT